MGELKSLRIERKLTTNQSCGYTRSFFAFIQNLMKMMKKKADSIKYKYMLEKISEINPIDEENGIVDIDYIKENALLYLINIMLISVICLVRTQKVRQNQPAMLIF